MNTDLRPKRILKPCDCDQQKDGKWGYRIMRWKKDKWHPVRTVGTVALAEVLARPYDRVLISCQGCGSDIRRE